MSAGTTEPTIAKPQTSILQTLINHPIGFWFIFWGELAERCSFYGMMAILPRFISEENGLYLGDANSNTWVSMFKAGAYLLPLAGGFLADQFFGKYRLIIIFSIPYILGHFLMSYETILWTMIALSLLAMGSGIIKPNISTLMGMTYDQKRPGDDALRSMAFGMFYMAINIGAALSYFFLPIIRDRYGYSIAFICPAGLMALSFVVFACGKPFYAVEKIVRTQSTPEERKLKWMTLRRVAGIFLVITFFWAIFDQSHTIWIFFARDFTDLRIFGWEISVEQIGTLNPVLIVLFVPLMPFLWSFVERFGYRVRPTDKIIIGFVLTAISMGVMSIAGTMCDAYEDKMVPRPEKAITKFVFDDKTKVSINIGTGKDDPNKPAETPKTERSAIPTANPVTVVVIAETVSETPKRMEKAKRYESDVRDILKANCVRCHGDTKQEGKLDVSSLEAIMKGGAAGPAVKANDPNKSPLLQAHNGLKTRPQEPADPKKATRPLAHTIVIAKDLKPAEPGGWVTEGQVKLIRDWVDTGATSTAQRSVSLWWEVLAFVMLTLAEVLISVTGLELAFVVAPSSMKSFVTALWLLTVFLANLFINAPVGRLYIDMTPAAYFAMLTGATFVVTIVFYFVALQFNRMAAEQEELQKQALASMNADPAASSPQEGIQDKTRREGFTDKDPQA